MDNLARDTLIGHHVQINICRSKNNWRNCYMEDHLGRTAMMADTAIITHLI